MNTRFTKPRLHVEEIPPFGARLKIQPPDRKVPKVGIQRAAYRTHPARLGPHLWGLLLAWGSVFLAFASFSIASAAVPATELDLEARIGGRTFQQWLEAAETWWKQTGGDSMASFALECRPHANPLLPQILQCLRQQGHLRLIEAMALSEPKKQSGDFAEWTRASALWLLYALNRTAAPAIPELVEMLKDRDWKQRIYVANAFQFIGPNVRQAAPTAIEDLQSNSEAIRQHGVLVAAACAQYEEAMVTELVRATRDPASLVRQTAIGFLSNLMFVSPQAGASLFQILQNQGPDASYVSVTLRIREAEQRLGRLCKSRHPEENRSLRPVIDR